MLALWDRFKLITEEKKCQRLFKVPFWPCFLPELLTRFMVYRLIWSQFWEWVRGPKALCFYN